MIVYVVKSARVEDEDGMELDGIRFVTLDSQKAHDFVAVYGVKEFMWIDGYELDSFEGNMVHFS